MARRISMSDLLPGLIVLAIGGSIAPPLLLLTILFLGSRRPLSNATALALGYFTTCAAIGVVGLTLFGGAESAARSGARSTSVDQRNNSIVNGAVDVPAPITMAFSFSAVAGAAPPSANVRSALTITSIATAVAQPATSVRLLPVTVVCTLGPTEPLHQSFQFFVFELGAALAHVDGHHAPSFGRIAGGIHPVDAMT